MKTLNEFKNKKVKGQANSFLPYLLFGIVLVFIFAMVTLVVSEIGDRAFDEIKNQKDISQSNEAVKRINQVQSFVTPAFDQLVFVILISIIIGTLVIAIFTDYHPVLVGVFALAIILLVIISGVMANAYDDIRDHSLLSSKADEFTFTNAIIGVQFPIIIAIVGIIAILILLGKRGRVVSPV